MEEPEKKKDFFSKLKESMEKKTDEPQEEQPQEQKPLPVVDPAIRFKLVICYLIYFIFVFSISAKSQENISFVVIGFSASLLSLILFSVIMLKFDKKALEHLLIVIALTTFLFFMGGREAGSVLANMDIPQLTILNMILSFVFVFIILFQVPKFGEDEEDEDELDLQEVQKKPEDVDYTSDYYFEPDHTVMHRHVEYHKPRHKPKRKPIAHPHIEDLRRSSKRSGEEIDFLRDL